MRKISLIIILFIPLFCFSQNNRIVTLNSQNSKILSVENNSTEKGAKVVIWDNVNQESIAWELIEFKKDYVKIKNTNSGLFLAVPGESKQKGVNLILWEDVNQESIKWKVEHIEGSKVKILNIASGLYLCIPDGRFTNGNTGILWEDINQPDIFWDIKKWEYVENTNILQYHYTVKSPDADIIVRVGDVDNLGFGFATGFDPFCGKNTARHSFPWKVNINDHPGTDRIMVVSSYKSGRSDGYVSSTRRPDNNPVEIKIKYTKPTVKINKVVLQMMFDDFQAPVWEGSYQFHINGKRLPYIEDVINKLSQTGPIGKLLQVGILNEDNKLFETGNISIKIDDPITGAGDGFAIDFIQVLINPKGEYKCTGNISGIVKDETGKLLENVLISANGLKESLTLSNGSFTLPNVPLGIITVTANKEMYSSASINFELQQKEDKKIELILKKKALESETYLSDEIKKKGFINLYGIYFDSNRDIPKSKSQSTLSELAKFLKNNPDIKIEIIGHTDSDGDGSNNKELSKRRAQSVIQWLKTNGIDVSNLKAGGLGENNPISSNKTESGKALNRRVELRIIK